MTKRIKSNLPIEQQLINLFNAVECEGATKPYYPEMLDFDLAENAEAEKEEVVSYLRTFGVPV